MNTKELQLQVGHKTKQFGDKLRTYPVVTVKYRGEVKETFMPTDEEIEQGSTELLTLNLIERAKDLQHTYNSLCSMVRESEQSSFVSRLKSNLSGVAAWFYFRRRTLKDFTKVFGFFWLLVGASFFGPRFSLTNDLERTVSTVHSILAGEPYVYSNPHDILVKRGLEPSHTQIRVMRDQRDKVNTVLVFYGLGAKCVIKSSRAGVGQPICEMESTVNKTFISKLGLDPRHYASVPKSRNPFLESSIWTDLLILLYAFVGMFGGVILSVVTVCSIPSLFLAAREEKKERKKNGERFPWGNEASKLKSTILWWKPQGGPIMPWLEVNVIGDDGKVIQSLKPVQRDLLSRGPVTMAEEVLNEAKTTLYHIRDAARDIEFIAKKALMKA